MHAQSLHLGPTLWDPIDCSLPGPSVHGVIQARILEWIALPSSRGSSRPRDWTCVSYISCVGRQVLYRQSHLGSQLIRCRVSAVGFPGGAVLKSPPANARRHQTHRFNPWVGKVSWSMKRHPTPVSLPEKFNGQRSLAGYSPWGCQEWDTTQHTHTLSMPYQLYFNETGRKNPLEKVIF